MHLQLDVKHLQRRAKEVVIYLLKYATCEVTQYQFLGATNRFESTILRYI